MYTYDLSPFKKVLGLKNVYKKILYKKYFFQCEKWAENPETFVEDEDEDSFTYSVRISSQDLLTVSFLCYLSTHSKL